MQANPAIPTTHTVNAVFPKIVPSSLVQNPDLSLAFILALVAGLIFWFILARTTLGYNIRATGFNIKAARYAGINVNRTIVVTLLISGAFAGLAGASVIFGVFPYQMQDEFDNFTIGFDAIAVALLGRNTATGAVLAAILYGALNHGSILMQQNALVDPHIIQMIEGLIILFVGADFLVRHVARKSGVPPLFLYRRYLGRLIPWRRTEGIPAGSPEDDRPPVEQTA